MLPSRLTGMPCRTRNHTLASRSNRSTRQPRPRLLPSNQSSSCLSKAARPRSRRAAPFATPPPAEEILERTRAGDQILGVLAVEESGHLSQTSTATSAGVADRARYQTSAALLNRLDERIHALIGRHLVDEIQGVHQPMRHVLVRIHEDAGQPDEVDLAIFGRGKRDAPAVEIRRMR